MHLTRIRRKSTNAASPVVMLMTHASGLAGSQLESSGSAVWKNGGGLNAGAAGSGTGVVTRSSVIAI